MHAHSSTVKFFLDNWYLFLMAATSGALLLWPVIGRGGGAGRVSTAQAVQLVNREKAVFIDVSEPAEFASAHVVGARSVPLGAIGQTGDLPKNKGLPLVLVCPSGARASRAVPALRKLGYEKVHVLAGGTAAWREANLPLEKSA